MNDHELLLEGAALIGRHLTGDDVSGRLAKWAEYVGTTRSGAGDYESGDYEYIAWIPVERSLPFRGDNILIRYVDPCSPREYSIGAAVLHAYDDHRCEFILSDGRPIQISRVTHWAHRAKGPLIPLPGAASAFY